MHQRVISDVAYRAVMNFVKCISLFLLVALLPVVVYAQNNADHQIEINIPEVALIAVVSETDDNVSFSPFAASEAGSTIVMNSNAENNSMWLNYSSIKNGSDHSRKVMAVVQGTLAKGIYLKVTPVFQKKTGGGELGVAGPSTILSNTPTELISGIGSCYTGKGVNNGCNLIYELSIEESELDFSSLHKQVFSFNILYTLTD